MTRWKRLSIESVRVICKIIEDIAEGQLTLRAMSLVYTTLLSLIPLLAISFSVVKGFGIHHEIEPFLITFLAPLGERADEIARRLVEFIDNTSVSVLGYAGFALLFYALISLMQKIERAFNYVWHVTHERNLTQRITDYLALIIVGPTLMFAATGIWASILGTNIMERLVDVLPLAWLVNWITRLLPVVLIVVAFTFIYLLVPNTKVHWRPALVGGIVGGVLWNIGGVGFALFIGNSANYPAIYSSFATAIFFMIWLYLAWLILLIGASVSFYLQNPTAVVRKPQPERLSNRIKERLGLAVLVAVGKRFYVRESPHTIATLAEDLAMPATAIEELVRPLEAGGFLLRAGEAGRNLVPARSLETVTVEEVIRRIRTHGEGAPLSSANVADGSIAEIWDRFERALGTAVPDVSIRDLSVGSDSSKA